MNRWYKRRRAALPARRPRPRRRVADARPAAASGPVAVRANEASSAPDSSRSGHRSPVPTRAGGPMGCGVATVNTRTGSVPHRLHHEGAVRFLMASGARPRFRTCEDDGASSSQKGARSCLFAGTPAGHRSGRPADQAMGKWRRGARPSAAVPFRPVTSCGTRPALKRAFPPRRVRWNHACRWLRTADTGAVHRKDRPPTCADLAVYGGGQNAVAHRRLDCPVCVAVRVRVD